MFIMSVQNMLMIGVCLLSYFLGNISPSTLLAKRRGLDIKKEGSGNAGTTNALRVLGKRAAIITLVVDIGKGVLAVLIGRAVGSYIVMAYPMNSFDYSTFVGILGGFFVFIGHIWPVVLGFKGGKGVATAFGVLVTINPLLGLSTLGVVAVTVVLFRMVSLGSILGALAVPLLAQYFEPDFMAFGCVMALIVIVKHRENIKRIFKGKENKLF